MSEGQLSTASDTAAEMVIVQPAVAETVVGFCMTGNHKVGVSILSFHQIISRQTAESLFYHGSSVHFIPHCKAVKCVSETAVQYILSVQIPMIRLQISGRTQNPFRFQITFRDDSGFKLENVNVVDHHLFIQDGTGIRFKGVIGIEKKQVFGITFEQGRNELVIDEHFFDNIVTENKEIPDSAKMDLAISMITLKYTQSNSVCYVKGGQAIGIGAGQQSRIHCTRLAGSKADNWWLRQSPQVLGLQFLDKIGRADRDNAIDLYIGEDYMDVLADGAWENIFKVKPEVFTREEKRAWLDKNTDVALGSDAFFPFGDNVERAHKSGVKYIAQPGGSIRDDHVIATCNKYGIAMAFTGIRLFHH